MHTHLPILTHLFSSTLVKGVGRPLQESRELGKAFSVLPKCEC